MCCRLSDNRVESFVSRMALLGLLDLGARNPRLVTGQSRGSKKQFAYVNKNKQKILLPLWSNGIQTLLTKQSVKTTRRHLS